MNILLLAQRAAWPDFRGMNIFSLAIFIVVVVCLVAVVFAVCKAVGVGVPQIAITIFWICFAGFLGIIGILFLASLL